MLLIISEVITLGYDSPGNVKRYEATVDSLKAGLKWGIILVGEGDSVFIGDSLLGVVPLSFVPDTFPVVLKVVGRSGKRIFSVDMDTSTVVVIYTSPAAEEEVETRLPQYEEREDGLYFNLNGKRVVVVKPIRRGWTVVKTFTDTSTLRYYWPRIDSLLSQVEGKGIIFVGALDVRVDGRAYPRGVRLINRVPGGLHEVKARGIVGKVRAYVDMDEADVVVFVLEPSPKVFLKVFSHRAPLSDIGVGAYACLGASVGGAVGCCVSAPSGLSAIGCMVGGVIGGVLGALLGSSCM